MDNEGVRSGNGGHFRTSNLCPGYPESGHLLRHVRFGPKADIRSPLRGKPASELLKRRRLRAGSSDSELLRCNASSLTVLEFRASPVLTREKLRSPLF